MQSCFCTTSKTFAPGFFDGYWSSCLSYASKYDPEAYSQLGPTGGGILSGTLTGIAISHGLGSKPCSAWNQYTQTTTPGPVSSQPSVPPPETSTTVQGGQAIALDGGAKVSSGILAAARSWLSNSCSCVRSSLSLLRIYISSFTPEGWVQLRLSPDHLESGRWIGCSDKF